MSSDLLYRSYQTIVEQIDTFFKVYNIDVLDFPPTVSACLIKKRGAYFVEAAALTASAAAAANLDAAADRRRAPVSEACTASR